MFKAIRWILLIYLLLCGLYYTYQHLFLFQPKKLEQNHVFSFSKDAEFTTASIPFDSANIIDIIKFHPKANVSKKGVVLFFHGNRNNVEHYARYAPYFTALGYECWMPDYPGYGRSTGELNVDMLQQLSLQLYKMARVNYQPDQIVVYGKSLGTGIAAYLASKQSCRALVLETPYTQLSDIAANYAFFLPTNLLAKYELTTTDHLRIISAPTTVIHGSSDELIPLTNAVKLTAFMKQADAFYVVPDGKHNNLPSFPLYNHIIDSVLKK